MHYCKWNKDDLAGLNEIQGITDLYFEVDDNGNVIREIGLNNIGYVVHKFPSRSYKYGMYGLFDNQKVILSDIHASINKEDFEGIWGKRMKKE